MAKLWLYFKKAVLVWGFISLAIALFITVTVLVQNYGSHQESAQSDQQPEEVLKKTFGDVELKVARDHADTDSLFVSVAKAGAPLIANYELPTKQFELNWVNITDANVISMGNKGYRIILEGGEYDCDNESAHYIWMLKLDGQMSFIKMLSLSGTHKIPGDETTLFGNKIITLPAFDEMKYEQIVIPMEISIKDSVKATPMLKQHSLALIKQHFGKIIQSRIDRLSKANDSALLNQYKAASIEFNEAISERIFAY